MERTQNMPYIVVTLEVSQLEISALKSAKSMKRPLMSVMAETSQSAMGQYAAVAAVGLASKPWTAVLREPTLVKVWAGGGEGDDAVARSTGSHCDGQAMPQTAQGSDFELVWPMAYDV